MSMATKPETLGHVAFDLNRLLDGAGNYNVAVTICAECGLGYALETYTPDVGTPPGLCEHKAHATGNFRVDRLRESAVGTPAQVTFELRAPSAASKTKRPTLRLVRTHVAQGKFLEDV